MSGTTSPLLRPPTSVQDDASRQWMNDMYVYTSILTQRVNALTPTSGSSGNTSPGIGPSSGLNLITSASLGSQTAFPTVFNGVNSYGDYAFTSYQISISGMYSSSSGKCYIVFTTNSGSTYDTTSGHYSTSVQENGTLYANYSTATGLYTSNSEYGSSAATGLTLTLTVSNPQCSGSGYCQVSGTGTLAINSTTSYAEIASGHYNQTSAAVTGFEFYNVFGTIAGGTVSIYGIVS